MGTRVLLRPLRGTDFPAWREVRLASREWLEPWEPRPEPGAADPVGDVDVFRARCSAWDRQRQFDAAYGFGLFLADDRFIGEVSLGSVHRGPFQSASVGYWVDERHAGNGYVPEGVALIIRYGFDDCACTASRPRSCLATRRAGGSRRSWDSARKARRSGSSRSTASTRTTCGTRSRSRSAQQRREEFDALLVTAR